MAFEGLKIEDITEAHINALIGVSEGRDLDFKRATYGDSGEDRRKFLVDISAFANTAGGYIIIGLAEDNEGGVATSIVPFTADVDAEIRRLESISLTGLQPRIIGMHIRAVPLATGGNVLVVYIPRSWNSPHRVIAQNSNRFHMRAGRQNYEPHVEELRQLFTSGHTFTQRLQDFKYDRIAKITSGATPVPLLRQTAIALHLIPYSTFLPGNNINISEIVANQGRFYPMQAQNSNWRFNLDGIVTYTGNASPYPAYTQVWRSGCIEAVRCPIVRQNGNENTISLTGLVAPIMAGCRNYINGMRALNVSAPFGIFVTVVGVKDTQLLIGQNYIDTNEFIDRDILFLSEIVLDLYPQDADIPAILQPIFDQIAQAGGYEASPDFDISGNIVR